MVDIVSVVKNAAVTKHLNMCKEVCKSSYNKLSSSERKHVDELLKAVVVFYRMALPYAPQAVAFAKSVSADNVVAFLKTATKIMQKPETAKLVEHYIAMYGDSIKNPKRLKAYGVYLKCVLSQLNPKYKKIVAAAIDFAFAFICLVVTKEIREYVKEIASNVQKYVIKPLHREVKQH